MLTQETKRKIDSARDILVGKVPDPKAQVEQITTALIYKFMDDMDKGSQELGGKARFFTGGFEKYSWTKLMDPKLGGHDRMDLYVETLTKLSLNPNIPQLFRDIFKDAFLPYRSPETLSLFLKEINGFTYEHSEDLGDSFEYLLSVLGSQGDAGQFRTPRHIIDFIVAAIDPKKDDSVCDPACGTAGFLISAYKHILKQYDGKDDPENKEKPLTPDERKNLMDHFTGYDISPDMVRLSRVNLYLHGFPSPTIYEYDTLSSEEKWDENFDIMLANPPFMTPKGGIRPHKRFSVQANRSEVLFVDYILEHLRPNGRAGIIVPEGIIFQSANAYKALRKMLVEDGLLAVVSLPSGIFNPYAGVKTCILLFDKALAKKTKHILFIKISNDGFDLGAQRRRIEKNDLPTALTIIKEYKKAVEVDQDYAMIPQMSFLLDDEQQEANRIATIVTKEKIAESGDYILSGDRYKKVAERTNQKWPMVKLGEVCEMYSGLAHEEFVQAGGLYILVNSKFVSSGGSEYKTSDRNLFPLHIGDVVMVMSDVPNGKTLGKCYYINAEDKYTLNQRVCVFRSNKYDSKFLYYYLNRNSYFLGFDNHQSQTNLRKEEVLGCPIPVITLEIQKEIVEQIEVKQQAIEHAKAIIKNLERERAYFGQSLRKLKDIDWVELDELCLVGDGNHSSNYPKSNEMVSEGIPFIRATNIQNLQIVVDDMRFISKDKHEKLKKGHLKTGDVLFSNRGEIGKVALVTEKYNGANLNSQLAWLRPKERLLSEYLLYVLNSDVIQSKLRTEKGGATLQQYTIKQIKAFQIPIPSLEVQKHLVAEVEREEEIITSNRRLIEIMEQKIADVLSEI